MREAILLGSPPFGYGSLFGTVQGRYEAIFTHIAELTLDVLVACLREGSSGDEEGQMKGHD